jgi:hypothetical protein
MATLWELRHLTESGLLPKTLAIMPPAPVLKRRRCRAGWNEARRYASEFNLDLPQYNCRGAILAFRQSDGVWTVTKSYGVKGSFRKRLAQGLIGATQELAQHSGVKLLN